MLHSIVEAATKNSIFSVNWQKDREKKLGLFFISVFVNTLAYIAASKAAIGTAHIVRNKIREKTDHSVEMLSNDPVKRNQLKADANVKMARADTAISIIGGLIAWVTMTASSKYFIGKMNSLDK